MRTRKIPPLRTPLTDTRVRTPEGQEIEVQAFVTPPWAIFFQPEGSSGASEGSLSALPTNLTKADKGFLYYVTDYEHVLEWTGTAWRFAPGDPGSGYIVMAGPMSPAGGSWAACDGSITTVLTGGGGTMVVTTPDLTGDVFIQGGAYGAEKPASRAKWEAGAKTGGGSVYGYFATSPGATEMPVAHDHALTDADAQLKPPSEAYGGLPKRIGLNFWMRR